MGFSSLFASRKIYWGTAITVAIALAAYIILSVQSTVVHSIPYQLATRYLKSDVCIARYLGSVNTVKLPWFSSLYTKSDSAMFNLSLYGSRRNGRVKIVLHANDGNWHVVSVKLIFDDGRIRCL